MVSYVARRSCYRKLDYGTVLDVWQGPPSSLPAKGESSDICDLVCIACDLESKRTVSHTELANEDNKNSAG